MSGGNGAQAVKSAVAETVRAGGRIIATGSLNTDRVRWQDSASTPVTSPA